MTMTKKEQEQFIKFKADAVEEVCKIEGKEKADDDIKMLFDTPDTKMILHRGFHNSLGKNVKPGWSRKQIMEYGAKCAARSISKSRMPMYK